MTCKIKQNIRVRKVCERIAKATHFHRFKSQEQRLLRLAFKRDRLEREIDNFWRYCKRNKNGVPYQDDRNDWNLFNILFRDQEKTANAINRIVDKYGLNELSLRDQYNQYSAGFGSSSF